jgi:Spy/CpxP family protein refolding chaperone
MKTRVLILLAVVMGCAGVEAQKAPSPPLGTDGRVVIRRHEMGKWWQDSETAKKLQLSDSQIAQLDQTFLDHRLKLIDDGAEMAKQDLKLQALLDADVPNEGQINSQVDQVLTARGKLERESTMMNLDLRKVLTVEQWRQLKAIHGDRGMGGDKFFYRFQTGGPGGPGGPPLPPLPPPGPGPDEQF